MAYNPLFDLAIGLFLILVPILILCGLLVVLVRAQEGTSTNTPSTPEQENWPSWVARTRDQAVAWNEIFCATHPESTRIHELERLIALLESFQTSENSQEPIPKVDPNESSQ